MTPPLVIPPYLKESPLTMMGMGGGATARRFYTASSDDEYQIPKSLRFNHNNLAYLQADTRGANTRTWTFSTWVKRNKLTAETGNSQTLFDAAEGGSNMTQIRFVSDDTLQFRTLTSGSIVATMATSAVFRDPTAWYHIVCQYDSTHTHELERVRLYVNGEKISYTNTNAIEQNQESHVNTKITIGGAPLSEGGLYSSFQLADTQFIDGLSLPPSAFGTLSAGGAWNPKAFALPAYNDGTTWSSSVSGAVDNASYSHDKLFDGLLGSAFNSTINGNNIFTYPDENTTNTFTPSSPIVANQQIRVWIYRYDDLGQFWWNSVDHTETVKATLTAHGQYGWVDMPTKTLTSMAWRWITGTGIPYMGAIEVDGVILIDGETDPALGTNNPNNGTIWSDYCTSTSGGTSPGSFAQLFSGSGGRNTGEDSFKVKPDTNGHTCSFIPPATITGTKIEVRAYCEGTESSTATIKVNDVSKFSAVQSAGGDGNGEFVWTDVGTSIDTTNGIKWGREDATNECCISAIRVDGHILRDGCQTSYLGREGFHLKYSNADSTYRLGIDNGNGKIAEADGALPFYNTSDDYGETKDSGYRSDSSAGNTDGTGLVLAIPGDVLTDEHDEIVTASTAHTITVSGSAAVSTSDSRFYGSSIELGSGKYLTTPSSTDFAFSTGDFTIEWWMNISSLVNGSEASPVEFTSGSGNINIQNSNRALYYFNGSSVSANNYMFDYDQWTHIAVVRDSGTIRFFKNGAAWGTGSCSVDYGTSARTATLFHGSPTNQVVGFINDFRMYKGVAKYTKSFKAPTRKNFLSSGHQTAGNAGTMYSEAGTWAFSPSETDINQRKNVFDSATDNYCNTALTSDGYLQYTFPSAVTVSSSLEVDYYNPDGYSITTYYTINDESERQSESPSGNNHFYSELKNGSGNTWTGSLEKIKLRLTRGGSQSHPVLYGIKIDGNVLYDGTLNEGKDSSTDSPTNYGDEGQAGGEVRGNYCVLNPVDYLQRADSFITDGGLTHYGTYNQSGWSLAGGTIAVPSDDSDGFYFEVKCMHKWNGAGWWDVDVAGGISASNQAYKPGNSAGGNDYPQGTCYQNAEITWFGDAEISTSGTIGTMDYGDVIGCAVRNNKIYYARNNTWTGDPVAETSPAGTLSAKKNLIPFLIEISTTGGIGSNPVSHVNFGQRPWKYSAPTGYKSINTANLPDTFGANNNSLEDKNNPSKYFNVTAYTGNGENATDIKGMNFQPDTVWIKSRSATEAHVLFDAIRGATKRLRPNTTDAEDTMTNTLTAFNSDGFQTNSHDNTNKDGDNYVSWSWDAGTAAATPSTDGTITPDAQWINATAGFSLIKYTGTQANATIGHGLSTAPDFMIHKMYDDGSTDWQAWHSSLNGTQALQLTTGGAFTQADMWNNTAPTDSVIHLGAGTGTNKSGKSIMLYVWTAVPGYSAFGTYTGNGGSAGPYVYTGFKPAFIIFKRTDGGPTDWIFLDAARDPYNANNTAMFPNTNSADATQQDTDFLSNGFKLRNSSGGTNGNNQTYSYCAWAENPLKTARAK